ncbi:uncharacterized protein ISCGN_019427 [Ixodes scapularis]
MTATNPFLFFMQVLTTFSLGHLTEDHPYSAFRDERFTVIDAPTAKLLPTSYHGLDTSVQLRFLGYLHKSSTASTDASTALDRIKAIPREHTLRGHGGSARMTATNPFLFFMQVLTTFSLGHLTEDHPYSAFRDERFTVIDAPTAKLLPTSYHGLDTSVQLRFLGYFHKSSTASTDASTALDRIKAIPREHTLRGHGGSARMTATNPFLFFMQRSCGVGRITPGGGGDGGLARNRGLSRECRFQGGRLRRLRPNGKESKSTPQREDLWVTTKRSKRHLSERLRGPRPSVESNKSTLRREDLEVPTSTPRRGGKATGKLEPQVKTTGVARPRR